MKSKGASKVTTQGELNDRDFSMLYNLIILIIKRLFVNP